MNKIIEQLAQKEYELFVVNTTAVAVQGRDGNYYTEYIPVTPFLLQNILSQKDHWAAISRNTERTGYVGSVLILTVTRKKIRYSGVIQYMYNSIDRFPDEK